jgi:hypothetical protein
MKMQILTNTLDTASSAYLRSAMHQPIHWQQWSEDTFTRAKEGDLPMLLDIGASWCQGSLKMDQEFYQSDEIAAIINAHYIAVKLDSDERPDVAARYQSALTAVGKQGGSPLTMFLTPDGKPFYGACFSLRTADGRASFRETLLAMAKIYREQNDAVEEEAVKLLNLLTHIESYRGKTAPFTADAVEAIVRAGLNLFDPKNGGFGKAPKLLWPAMLDLLLYWYAQTGEQQAGAVATATLEKLARSGVYDQVAGGFHHSAIDDAWRVPHFEKLACDNAELLKTYVHAWQVTGNAFFADVAREIMRWMDASLSDRERGGFFASERGSLGPDDNGGHFTWTRDEARSVLTKEEFEAALLHWNLDRPGKNVLWVRASVEEIATRTKRELEPLRALIASARNKLYEARQQRPLPYIDRTLYTGWNALCISAYLQAARAFGASGDKAAHEQAQQFALLSLDRLLAEAWNEKQGELEGEEGQLDHVLAYPNGDPGHRIPLLDDYAFTVLACLDAYETTVELRYLEHASAISIQMFKYFYEGTLGGFIDIRQACSPPGALRALRKSFRDALAPAGNPAAAIALMRLCALTGNDVYQDRARQTLEVIAGAAGQLGIEAGTYGVASIWLSRPHTQVVVVGEGAEADELYAAALRPLALTKAVLRIPCGHWDSLPPALAETMANLSDLSAKHPVAVVCRNFTCHPPVTNAAELTALLGEVLP